MTLLDLAYSSLVLLHRGTAFLLLLYALNCYILLLLHRCFQAKRLREDHVVWQAWQAGALPLPCVTVQLPIYNERYVIQRLLEAIVHLQYPKELLDIQVLDDSTDETTALAARQVQYYRQAGFDITLMHRRQRHGFKAGALQAGMHTAKGAFIAIFDADFTPAPDFLMRMLPFFQDPTVAAVQARWGHINGDYSVLSRAQAFGINGHFWVEQAGRCWAGLFMNFNGSGGIWRRQAIDKVGGWQADTLTEDLDLSYRAQLQGWRLKFLPQVVCPAELPVQMNAVKSQQYRWAKGSIQTAKKLLPSLLLADVPLFTKYQALCHLTNYMVHPLMLIAVLVAPLMLGLEIHASTRESLMISACFALASLGPSSMYLYAHRQLYADWKARLWAFPFLIILGMGIALSNTKAIAEALCNINSPFVRTPKFRIERPTDTWVGKRYRTAWSWLVVGEALLALYCAYWVFLSMQQRDYVNPFPLLFALGFASVAFLSVWESQRK